MLSNSGRIRCTSNKEYKIWLLDLCWKLLSIYLQVHYKPNKLALWVLSQYRYIAMHSSCHFIHQHPDCIFTFAFHRPSNSFHAKCSMKTTSILPIKRLINISLAFILILLIFVDVWIDPYSLALVRPWHHINECSHEVPPYGNYI